MKPCIHRTHPIQRNGFALVVTVSMMVILTVVAVGLLGLSSITLKSSSLESAQARARANARMALMMAIDRLQSQLGPDQRISANAEILDANPNTPTPDGIPNPKWLGVWESWHAGTVQTDLNPDAFSHHQTIVSGRFSKASMHPTYDNNREDHFRSWLVSLPDSSLASKITTCAVSLNGSRNPTIAQNAVILVDEGTLGTFATDEGPSDPDKVTVPLVSIGSDNTNSTIGRYAWWVGDENQKARIMDDSYETDGKTLSSADHLFRNQAPASLGNETVDELKGLSNKGKQQLASIISHDSMDLLDGSASQADPNADGPSTRFHDLTTSSLGVLADVREGGLKRDLSTLLERPIVPLEDDTGSNDINDFMLYRFTTKDGLAGTTKPQEIVPIQDLAAYYQMYDALSSDASSKDPNRTNHQRGVQYDSSAISNGPHLMSVNYGTDPSQNGYLREYTSLYRQPRIIKVQFLLSMFAQEIVPAIKPDKSNPKPNTHELLIGVTPSITLWNPTNLPLTMQFDASKPDLLSQMMRYSDPPIQLRISKNDGTFVTKFIGLQDLTGNNDAFFNLYWSGLSPVRLEPGEVKTMSLPYFGDLSDLKSKLGLKGHWTAGQFSNNFFMKTDTYFVGHEVKPGWDPESFILMNGSAALDSKNFPDYAAPGPNQSDRRHIVNDRLRFRAADTLTMEVNNQNNKPIVSYYVNHSPFQDFAYQPSGSSTGSWDAKNFIMGTREDAGATFYQELCALGMTGGAASLTTAERKGTDLIARSSDPDRVTGWPFLQYSVQAAVEVNESASARIAAGRKFASRPFLHSSPLHAYPFLDAMTETSLYNFGWNWSIDLINDSYEAPVDTTPNGQGFYGGGYTSEFGTNHVIQQEIPVVPPISIAALSSAYLGGFSVSDQDWIAYDDLTEKNAVLKRQWTRAIGFGGLAPFTLQAIGNSYAHPLIPADAAYDEKFPKEFSGTTKTNITLADHSYLANKALWDEFFFSSITPQPTAVEIFGSGSGRDAKTVASEFFFGDKPLPNRRMQPYKFDLDQDKLDDLFTEYGLFQDGFADKIAAHMMIEGAFNINSTSVDAWKALFSSLKGKPVAYLDASNSMNGGDPSITSSHTGTPVGQAGLGGGPTYSGGPSNSRDSEQWTSWRELTDDEIDLLAIAMVKQVKLRGPFLSLSEFVNRRLVSKNDPLSLKGALQAALDDNDISDGGNSTSINEAIWNDNDRLLDSETGSMGAEFPEAAEGPIAYGSPAYVDQADILRHFSSQLTPRGDTFVIRAYGDAMDANGNVEARAWCEAVIQRIPDYVDSADEPHETAAKPGFSIANATFGRKLQLVNFRWLNPSEI